MEQLIQYLGQGETGKSAKEAERLLESGVSREEIVTNAIEVAMERLSDKCTAEQFNLLEIMLSGRAVNTVVKTLFPHKRPFPAPKASVVLATLQGDVHDLGKNILKTVLTASRYVVFDCGRDCEVGKFIESAQEQKAQVVAISGLITSVIPQVKTVRTLLSENGLADVKIIAGGAALKQATPSSLNVDFVADDVFEGLRYLDEAFGGKE